MDAAAITPVRAPRSAVSSGRRRFVAEGDGRSVWARRHADIVLLHIGDLGGTDLLSEAQLSLIRRAATLETELERQEATLSRGENVDLDAYGRVVGQLRRILETLGLKRVPREVGPSDIHAYARLIRESEAADA